MLSLLLVDPIDPRRACKIDLGRFEAGAATSVGSVGEKACSESDSDSLDGSNGGRRGGPSFVPSRESASYSPSIRGLETRPSSVDTDTLGKVSSPSASSTIVIPCGGEAMVAREIGRRRGGEILSFSEITLLRFSLDIIGGGTSKPNFSLGVMLARRT